MVLRRMALAELAAEADTERSEVTQADADTKVIAILNISGLAGSDDSTFGPPPIKQRTSSTFVKDVPIFSLKDLFPPSAFGDLHVAVTRVLDLDTENRPARSPSDTLRDPGLGLEPFIAVQRWSASGNAGKAGWPVVKALLRLRMWKGQGWVESST
jgi:hypothetical protein